MPGLTKTNILLWNSYHTSNQPTTTEKQKPFNWWAIKQHNTANQATGLLKKKPDKILQTMQ